MRSPTVYMWVGMLDPEYLRDYYAGLCDEALMAVDCADLGELARAFYDEEMEQRGLRKHEMPANPPLAVAVPVSPRLRDVRRAALFACIATVLGMAVPIWNSARQILALESRIGQMGAIAAIVAISLFTAIVPLFYFALYRDMGDLPVPGSTRWLAMTAAVTILIVILAAIPGWIESFRSESVLDGTARPWTIGDTCSLLGAVKCVADILLLVALFRLAGAVSEKGVAVSKLLRVLTRVAVIAGGIAAVWWVMWVVATPWVYLDVRDRIRMAIMLMCGYVAPFLAWRGSRTRMPSGST